MNLLKLPKQRFNSYRNVTSKLHLAKKKLLPVINDILKTASENASKTPNQHDKSYYLTLEQYNDAMWAAQLLKEFDSILKTTTIKKQFRKPFKPQNFNFDVKVKVNKSGKIYIDTHILVQLIDLHNLLGDIIDFIQQLSREECGVLNESSEEHDTSQSKSETVSSDSVDESQQIKTETIAKEVLTLPLSTDFTVMTAQTISSKDIIHQGVQSSTEQRSQPEVTTTLGARKIIIRCMADLEKVRHFLERDYSVHAVRIQKSKSRGVVDVETDQAITSSFCSLLSEEVDVQKPKNACCCLETCPGEEPLEFTWKENGETGSKLVICIKGKTEEDGDIHVVIRQCPECLNSKNKEGSNEDIKTIESEPSVQEETNQENYQTYRDPSKISQQEPSHISHHEPSHISQREPSHISQREPSHISQREPSHISQREPSHISQREPSHISQRDPSHISHPVPSHVSHYEYTRISQREPSHISHEPSRISQREPSHISDLEPSTTSYRPQQSRSTHFQAEPRQQHINVIFDPDNPSHSIVEGPTIGLNDIINLNLKTNECKQDLIISLSVKPKGGKSKHNLTIDDIFCDSHANINEHRNQYGSSNVRLGD